MQLSLPGLVRELASGEGSRPQRTRLFWRYQGYSLRKSALKKPEGDLLAKKNVLSKEEYGKSMNELRKKFSDYQTDRRSAIDNLTAKRAQAREALLKELDPILGAYVKENSISLVIDKKITLGGQPGNDITAAIVEKLNKSLPSLNLK